MSKPLTPSSLPSVARLCLHVCAHTSGRPRPQSRRWWSWLEPQQPCVGSRGPPQCNPALAPEAQAVWGSLTLGCPRRALDLNGRAGAASGGPAEAAVPQEQRSPSSRHWGSSSGLHDLGWGPFPRPVTVSTSVQHMQQGRGLCGPGNWMEEVKEHCRCTGISPPGPQSPVTWQSRLEP